MDRGQILDAVKVTITKDRQDTHGNPENTHDLIAYFWSGYISQRHVLVELTAQDAAVMMALMKIARHAVNPSHFDNCFDGTGYMAIAGELRDDKPTHAG